MLPERGKGGWDRRLPGAERRGLEKDPNMRLPGSSVGLRHKLRFTPLGYCWAGGGSAVPPSSTSAAKSIP